MTNALELRRRRQENVDVLAPQRTFFSTYVDAYKELISRPHIAKLTPAERIAATRREWFTADMAHASAFLRADRHEMARLDVLREALLDSYLILTRYEMFEAIIAESDVTPTDTTEDEDLRRARRACMAAVNKAGLSDDSLTMCGAYLNYFNEYAGTTRKEWTAAMWRKMANAVSGGAWRGESGQWIRVSYRRQLAA